MTAPKPQEPKPKWERRRTKRGENLTMYQGKKRRGAAALRRGWGREGLRCCCERPTPEAPRSLAPPVPPPLAILPPSPHAHQRKRGKNPKGYALWLETKSPTLISSQVSPWQVGPSFSFIFYFLIFSNCEITKMALKLQQRIRRLHPLIYLCFTFLFSNVY